MHNDLVELGWTEEQWSRITGAVTEEAQRARVAAQMLPMVGPEDPSTVAVPAFSLKSDDNKNAKPPDKRLTVDSNPTLYLTTIAVNVHLRSHEVADPNLKAALGMFRRAANYIARIEDALVFNGRKKDKPPAQGIGKIPEVYTVTGDGDPEGVFQVPAAGGKVDQSIPAQTTSGSKVLGDRVFEAIVEAIGKLDELGQQAPYACALSQDLFTAICSPNLQLILPRDRILPFLQGPLLRASALPNSGGVVVSLSGSSVELVVGSDLSVRYLQATLEPRYVFRVCERVALRIREQDAIAVLHP